MEGFLKLESPVVTMAFNAKSWSNDLDDLRYTHDLGNGLGYPHFRKPPYIDSMLSFQFFGVHFFRADINFWV